MRATAAARRSFNAGEGVARWSVELRRKFETVPRQERVSVACAPPSSPRWMPSGVPYHCSLRHRYGPAISSATTTSSAAPRGLRHATFTPSRAIGGANRNAVLFVATASPSAAPAASQVAVLRPSSWTNRSVTHA